MKNSLTDLRNHLFETLEKLKDPDDPMELDRAAAVADVGRVLVDTAKVEAATLKTMIGAGIDALPSEFFGTQRKALSPARTKGLGNGNGDGNRASDDDEANGYG